MYPFIHGKRRLCGNRRGISRPEVNERPFQRGGKGGGLGSEEAEVALPAVLALSNGSPNPAAGPIDFALDLPRAATVQWAVFDVQGRAVWSEERSIGAGTARLHWDGTSSRGERVAKGIYLARVRVDGTQFMRRIVRL